MSDSNSILDRLKQKHAPLFRVLDGAGFSLHRVQIQDGKLYLKATSDSDSGRDAALSALSSVDPDWEREVNLDIRTEAGQHSPGTGQTTVNTSQDFSTAQ